MNKLLTSIKADLLDRRLLPFVAVVGVALVGALAYVVLAGGSGSSSPKPGAGPVPVPKGIAVTPAATNAKQPVAETTSGSSVQRHGFARNPFKPLPSSSQAKSSGAAASATATATRSSSTTTSSTGSGSSGGSASGGSGGGSGSAPKAESSPATPAPAPSKPKAQTVYHVSVLFGALPAVTPPGGLQLTAYNDLKLLTSLPSSKLPLLVFRGVTSGGKSATFSIAGEAILRGSAMCVPSPSQCQAIDLKPGQAEQLEYLPASGTPVTYEVRVVKISSAKASGAAVARMQRSASSAGRKVLAGLGLLAIPGMRGTAAVGVLAFVGQTAKAARASAR